MCYEDVDGTERYIRTRNEYSEIRREEQKTVEKKTMHKVNNKLKLLHEVP